MRLKILFGIIFLLFIAGLLNFNLNPSREVSNEALQQFLVIPEEATQLQTYQFGRGMTMARGMYIKFRLPSDSMNTLFDAMCIKAEELSPTYRLQLDSFPEVPSWFSPTSENTSGGTCWTVYYAIYKIIVENQQSENVIYIVISVL